MEVDLTSKFDEQGHFVVAEFKDKNANTLNLNTNQLNTKQHERGNVNK